MQCEVHDSENKTNWFLNPSIEIRFANKSILEFIFCQDLRGLVRKASWKMSFWWKVFPGFSRPFYGEKHYFWGISENLQVNKMYFVEMDAQVQHSALKITFLLRCSAGLLSNVKFLPSLNISSHKTVLENKVSSSQARVRGKVLVIERTFLTYLWYFYITFFSICFMPYITSLKHWL